MHWFQQAILKKFQHVPQGVHIHYIKKMNTDMNVHVL